MRLFFKNGLLQILKDKVQFSIYMVLVFFTIVFASAFGATSSYLVSNNKYFDNSFVNYNYSYKYTSSGYSANDTATVSPWFAFDAETVKYDGAKNSKYNVLNFPTLTIQAFSKNNVSSDSTDGALLAYKFSDNTIYRNIDGYEWVNFHFGDDESALSNTDDPTKSGLPIPNVYVNDYSDNQKFECVKSAQFGDFYRFNTNYKYFRNSLIGKLYSKYNFQSTDIINWSKEAKSAALNIFSYMFYLNNSSITGVVKNYIIQKYDKIMKENFSNDAININEKMSEFIDGTVSKHGNYKIDPDTILDDNGGLNGRIGWIDSNSLGDSSKQTPYFLINENNQYGRPIDKLISNENCLLNYGSYYVKNYEDFDIFETEGQSGSQYIYNNNVFTNQLFFNSYNSLVADLTNFDCLSVSQVVMWGSDGGKYKYISAFYNFNNEAIFYNKNLMRFYDQRNDNDSSSGKNFVGDTFAVSIGYASARNLVLGNSYNIFDGTGITPPPDGSEVPSEFRFDATAGDSMNTYPTIYDEDLVTNNSKDGIFYLLNNNFRLYFDEGDGGNDPYVSSDKYQDISRTYLKYNLKNQKNMNNDMQEYRLYLANNIVNLGKAEDIINTSTKPIENISASNIISSKSSATINLKSNLLPNLTKIFILIAITFTGLFAVIVLFVVYHIVKKLLVKQKTQLGNLKSLGVRKTKLVVNFISYMLVPLFVVVPLSWAVAIGLEKLVIGIFATYFNIENNLPINWHLLIYEMLISFVLVGFMVFFISFLTIRQHPLELLNNEEKYRKHTFINNVVSKFKYFKFTSKLRSKIIVTSFGDIFTYFLIFFISSMVLSSCLILPGTVKKMSNTYYSNIKYQNKFDYGYIYSNVPTTRYGFYQTNYEDEGNDSDNSRGALENKASTLSAYWKDKNGDYKSLLNQKNWASDDNYRAAFEYVLINNLLSIKGFSLSVNQLDKLVDISRSIGDSNDVSTDINLLVDTFLPQIFGQKTLPSGTSYTDAIKEMANNLVPSSVKSQWDKNNNLFKLFSINFGKMSYDPNNDQLYTSIDGYAGNPGANQQSVSIYGINKDSKNQNLNIDNIDNFLSYDANTAKNGSEKIIPVTVNKKLKLHKWKVGNVYPIYIKDNKAYFINKPIENSWWIYNNSTLSDKDYLWRTDLSKLTYISSGEDNSVIKSGLYYKNNDQYIPYSNVQDIQLKIPAKTFEPNSIQAKLLQKVNNDYKEYSNNQSVVYNPSEEFKISPFDVRQYDNNKPLPINDLTSVASHTKNWWYFAIKDGLITQNNNYVDSGYKVKVKGYQNLYDGYSIYMSQTAANEILGYQDPSATTTIDESKINIWSNAKMSKDGSMSDQTKQIVFQTNYGDTSVDGLSKNTEQAINKVVYVGETKQIVDKLVGSIYSFAIVFIVIAIITSLIICYLITDLFVGKFKSFMSFMRIQGYTMREINSIILWIFLPITLISIILGELLVCVAIVTICPHILIQLDIAVSLTVSKMVMLYIFLCLIAIFAFAYAIVLYGMKKIKLASLTGSI